MIGSEAAASQEPEIGDTKLADTIAGLDADLAQLTADFSAPETEETTKEPAKQPRNSTEAASSLDDDLTKV